MSEKWWSLLLTCEVLELVQDAASLVLVSAPSACVAVRSDQRLQDSVGLHQPLSICSGVDLVHSQDDS